MSPNATAPRNGTLRREDALPLANQPCRLTARVPVLGGVCLPKSITLLLVLVELEEHLIPMGFVRKCEIYVLVVLRQVGFVLIA